MNNKIYMKKKKICIITPRYPPENWGGLAKTVKKVSNIAAKLILNVHIAHISVENNPCILLDENKTTEIIDNITVHRIKSGKEIQDKRKRKLGDCPHTLTLQMIYHSLEKLYLKENFTLFHSFFLFPSGYIAGLIARRYNIPLISTIVGNDINKYFFSPEKVASCRSGLENADIIVALSKDLMDKADSLTPVKHKTKIIYNSIFIPDEKWKKPEGKPVRVGFAGIFKYAKGLPYLFKAVANIAKKEDIVLELVGKVREEEEKIYNEAVEKTGVKPFLKLHSPMPQDKIYKWLRELHLFVLPSLTEGCPNILMEAMASGLPCIATETGANSILIENMVSGLLVPWGDSKELEKAILKIIRNKSLAQSLGREAREKMSEFSVEREIKSWEEIYRKFIKF